MKLLTPYGMSDYIPGGIVSANRGDWELVRIVDGDPKCVSCPEYDLVSTTNLKAREVTWWYRPEIK